jgi:hypothetical protein
LPSKSSRRSRLESALERVWPILNLRHQEKTFLDRREDVEGLVSRRARRARASLEQLA